MDRDRDFDVDPMQPGRAKYQDRYDHSYAILVGINTYLNPRLRPLGNAEDDARRMAQVLSSGNYDFNIKLLLGEEATRQAITRELNRISRISEPDDRVIFYYAGHGYIQPDNRGVDIGYLACADTDPEDPFDGLEYDQVTRLTHYAQAKHIAFVFDACFSGTALGLTRAVVQPAAVKEYLFHQAYQVLTAGAAEVVSDTRSMTGELVKVLREGIPGQTAPLTFSHLGQYIHDVIHNETRGRQSPSYGLLIGSGKGQMVLRTPDPFGPLPDDIRAGLTHPDPLTRRFAVAEAERLLDDPILGPVIRAVLMDMQVDDDDRLVRRRASQVLLSVGLIQPAQPSVTPPAKTSHAAPIKERTAEPAAPEIKAKAGQKKEPLPTHEPAPPLDPRQQIKLLARSKNQEDLLACPICNTTIKARNLVQHYDRTHAKIAPANLPSQREQPTTQVKTGEFKKQPSLTRPPILAVLEKSRLVTETPKPRMQEKKPASAAVTPVNPRQQIKLMARTVNQDDFLICPVCNTELKARNLVQHYDRTHANEPSALLPDLREQLKSFARTKNGEDFVACPVCQEKVKARNLVLHYDRRHQQDLGGSLQGKPVQK